MFGPSNRHRWHHRPPHFQTPPFSENLLLAFASWNLWQQNDKHCIKIVNGVLMKELIRDPLIDPREPMNQWSNQIACILFLKVNGLNLPKLNISNCKYRRQILTTHTYDDDVILYWTNSYPEASFIIGHIHTSVDPPDNGKNATTLVLIVFGCERCEDLSCFQ